MNSQVPSHVFIFTKGHHKLGSNYMLQMIEKKVHTTYILFLSILAVNL
jgi:hypothetical protein